MLYLKKHSFLGYGEKLIKKIYTPPPSLSLLLFFTYYHFKAYKEMVLGSADTNNPFF